MSKCNHEPQSNYVNSYTNFIGEPIKILCGYSCKKCKAQLYLTDKPDFLPEPESAYDQLLADARELQKALEKLQSGYSGMFGHDGMTPEMEAWKLAPEIVEKALETFTKKYGDIK